MSRRGSKIVREINNQKGMLKDANGNVVNVRFSLVQWQDYVDDVPTLRHANGSIQFDSRNDSWAATADGTIKTLEGGGIRAQVLVVSSEKFAVTGPVTDL